MATYLIVERTNGQPVRSMERHTRAAAYNAAYRCWYADLSVSGGLDTRSGWNGVNALGTWLIDRTQCEVTISRHDFSLTIARTS